MPHCHLYHYRPYYVNSTTPTTICVLMIPVFTLLKGRANLERLGVRMRDNIKMVIKEIYLEGVDWT